MTKIEKIHLGFIVGSLSVFVSMLGASITFPFLQSQRDLLGCDALCYGSLQSVRSALSLIGSSLVGRLSDRFGRLPMLWIGLISSFSSYLISYSHQNIRGLWLSMIPVALLNQNYSVIKALFADYNFDNVGDEAERTQALGRLGMSVGISFMIGPLISATFIKSYEQAMIIALIFSFISGIIMLFLPNSSSEVIRRTKSQNHLLSEENIEKTQHSNSFFSFMNLPVVKLPGSQLLFFMRLMMGISFSIFMTVWVSFNSFY